MTKVRAVVRRRWPIVVVTTVVGLLAGAVSGVLASDGGPSTYVVDQVLVTATGDAASGASVSRDALKVTRGEVPSVAAELLGRPDERAELLSKVSVASEPETGSITITATDSDPEEASNIVQAFSQAFLDVVNAELRAADQRQLEQLQSRAEAAQEELAAFDEANADVLRPDAPVPDTAALNALLAERTRLVDAAAAADQRVADFELEIAQSEPYSTLGVENPELTDSLVAVPSSAPFRAALLGGLGFLLGVGLVVVLERTNRRIDTREELAQLVSVPILAEVGVVEEDVAGPSGNLSLTGPLAEPYRRVRAAVNFVQTDAGNRAERAASATGDGAVLSRNGVSSEPRVFLVTSALPGEGKTTSTVLTAMALAEAGQEALVVNADVRKPTMETYLGIPTSPSLADMADLRPDRPGVDQVVQATSTPGLWAVAAGPPTMEVEGRLRAVREVAVETARRGGTVVIDSSPLHATNDPVDLLPVVDEVILVVRAGQSTVRSVTSALRTLDMHRAPVLGLVMVGTRAGADEYAYYEAYTAGSEESGRPARRRGRRGESSTSVAPAQPHAQPQPAQPQPAQSYAPAQPHAQPQPQPAQPHAQPQPVQPQQPQPQQPQPVGTFAPAAPAPPRPTAGSGPAAASPGWSTAESVPAAPAPGPAAPATPPPQAAPAHASGSFPGQAPQAQSQPAPEQFAAPAPAPAPAPASAPAAPVAPESTKGRGRRGRHAHRAAADDPPPPFPAESAAPLRPTPAWTGEPGTSPDAGAPTPPDVPLTASRPTTDSSQAGARPWVTDAAPAPQPASPPPPAPQPAVPQPAAPPPAGGAPPAPAGGADPSAWQLFPPADRPVGAPEPQRPAAAPGPAPAPQQPIPAQQPAGPSSAPQPPAPAPPAPSPPAPAPAEAAPRPSPFAPGDSAGAPRPAPDWSDWSDFSTNGDDAGGDAGEAQPPTRTPPDPFSR